jgi:hypothetical protein
MMLEEVEGDAPIAAYGNQLTFEQRVRRKMFRSVRDEGKVSCEHVATPGPERNARGILAG